MLEILLPNCARLDQQQARSLAVSDGSRRSLKPRIPELPSVSIMGILWPKRRTESTDHMYSSFRLINNPLF